MKIPRYEGKDRYDRLTRFLQTQFPLAPQELALRHQFATPLSRLTLTTAYQDVPDTAITVPRNGVYACFGVIDAVHEATGGTHILARLAWTPPGAGLSSTAIVAVLGDIGIANHRATVSQIWFPTFTKGTVVKLQGSKSTAGGTAKIYETHTSFFVFGPVAVL